MSTQTGSAAALPAWIPIFRVRLARLIAYRRALHDLAGLGIPSRQARLLAREMADRVRV